MTTWSIWNYATKRYDYYEGGQATGTHAGTPPSSMIGSQMGATPDQAAWRLPTGARKIGVGTVARGRVASLGDDGFDLPPLAIPIALGAVALYFWSKHR